LQVLTTENALLLKSELAFFMEKTLSTVDPSAEVMPNWHIDLIAEYLEAARRGKIRRLIINMPPRYLKSVCVSVAWPAWVLGHDPSARIIGASYALSLSVKHTIDCRVLMGSPWYRQLFPAVQMSTDQNEKHKFVTTRRGHKIATSVGGAITGEGGNFLILDDPINPAMAENTHLRNYVNQWFDHTFSTRLDDKHHGVIVLVMQRLHAQDLSGYLLKRGGWEQLCLPAIAEQKSHHDFGAIHKQREQGEALHPRREPPVLIERAKTDLGSHAFKSQYQQQPVSETGVMINRAWLARYHDAPQKAARRVQSWDTAIKAGKQHDASVCLTFDELEGYSYLRDVQRVKLEYPDLKRRFIALADEWRPDVILVEDKASGQQLLQDLKRETRLPLIAVLPRADKVTRLAAVSARIEAGRLLLPYEAPWLADLEVELLGFPNHENDDQVDALIHYLDWLRSSGFDQLRLRKI
jgi:predicted phage terminase large subunit-like protein